MDPRVIAAVVASALGGCSPAPRDRPSPARQDAGATRARVPKDGACDETVEIGPGLIVQRMRAPIDPPLPVGDRCLIVVRIDPARHRFDLLAAGRDGERKTVRQWADDHDLLGVINASMFHESGQSSGPEASLLVRGTGAEVLAIGSYESLFRESDDNLPGAEGAERRSSERSEPPNKTRSKAENASLWPLPNVIGFRAISPTSAPRR